MPIVCSPSPFGEPTKNLLVCVPLPPLEPGARIFIHLLIGLQGTYVLTDAKFRWLLRIPPAGPEQRQQLPEFMADFLSFPCAIIRG